MMRQRGKTAATLLFNWYVFGLIVLVLAFGGSIRAYSSVGAVVTHDRNMTQIGLMDTSRRDFTFAVFGDNRGSQAVFDQVLRRVGEDHTAFGVDMGDLVMQANQADYTRFIHQVSACAVPVVTGIGNHDVGITGRGCYYDMLGPYYYAFTVGESRFIVLDDVDPAGLGEAQMRWLESELSSSGGMRYRFVFMHKPLFDPREGQAHCMENAPQAGRISQMLDQYRVTLAFAGHIHGSFQGAWGKTPYVITGGAGQQLAGNDPAHYFYNYVDVSVSPDGVKTDVAKLDTKASWFQEVILRGAWVRTTSFISANYFVCILPIGILYFALFLLFRPRKA